MINITKENIEIEDSLNNRIKSITKFLGVKSKLTKGKLISIDKTNLAYIEPHKLEINNITYLFFNDSNLVYINTLENSIEISALKDLGQIGAHNGRLKEAYKSNPDINKFKSNENIQIIDCNKNYYNSYMKLVKDYKEQHDKKQEVERENRKKTFNQMLDDSNSVVADELLFTSDKEFFKNMDKDEIIKWANTCIEFVYEDIGYNKNQILNAVIHLDEKTPHLHCVVVPLIKKYDKRSKEEKWTISKKQYMKDRDYLSTLQDKYHSRMVKNGYDLDRGIKNSDNEHIDIKQYKQITRKLNLEITSKNEKLNNAMSDLENKMETNKETIFDKEFVKIKKDTFESMNKVINETKKVIELQPKIQRVYNEVDEYAKSYKYLEKENENIKREVEILKYKNNNLERENSRLNNYIESILEAIKRFFRQILKIGNKEAKNEAVIEIKDFYNKEDIDKDDVYQLAKDTNKEDELFKYADVDKNYFKDDIELYKFMIKYRKGSDIMINLQTDIKKLVSTLKNIFYSKEEFLKFDIINNGNISLEYITSNGGFNYQVDFYNFIVELNIKYYSKISKENDIEKLEKEICDELTIVLKGADEQISEVTIKPLIENYINWHFIADIYTKDEFIHDLKRLKEILYDTSIGKNRIENVNDEYVTIYDKVNLALQKLDIDNPNTFNSMWEAYNYWKSNLDDYAKRRVYFSNMYEELFKNIIKNEDLDNNISSHLEYTGWSNINKIIADIKKAFMEATNTPQFNGIGAMCRNLYNTLANEIFKPEYHADPETEVPTGDKYKNKLIDYVTFKLNGSTNDDFRSYCKKTIDLADNLTHKMTANQQQAALTITALISVVNIIEILENSSVKF